MEPFLSVYGHVAIDQIMTVADFPKDNTTVDVLTRETHLGGTGTNIAVVASRLGVPTALCAFVGVDFTDEFRKEIESAGTITDELLVIDGYYSSQALIVNDSKLDQKVLFYQGPQGSGTKVGVRMLKNAKRSEYVHFCTGEPDYYLDLMEDIDCRIAWDPAQEVHRFWNERNTAEAMARTDYVFCNRFEFESLKKYLRIDSIDEIDRPLAVCTCGADGSEAVIDGEHFHIPTVKAAKVVDATGAGDSYRAGFYAGLYHGYDLHESLVIGATVSSFIVEATGSMTNAPDWDRVMERADEYLKVI